MTLQSPLGEITRIDALTSAQCEAWRAFQAQNQALASPYFSLEFAQAVADVRQDTAALVITQNGTLRGFLPLHLSRTGVARPLGGPLGDHHGVISDDNQLNPLAALKSAGLKALSFEGALADQTGLATQMSETQPSWAVDLSAGYEAWLADRQRADAKAMRNIRARRRKLEDTASELVVRVDDRREAVFDALFELKREQYRRTRAVDVFVAPWARHLVKDMFHTQTPEFGGLLSTLEIDGQMAAAHFGIRSQHVLHYWFPVFDHQFAKFGPGLHLFMEIAQQLESEGIQQIHLGPGAMDFKKRLANTSFEIGRGQWAQPSLTAAMLNMGQRVDQWAKGLPLGPAALWPGKALRRLDTLAAVYGV
jgi:CelD/BcsL family acetyltransferase involved in cellulose biosynthesis